MPKLPIAIFAALISVPTLVAAQSMTAQQYHKQKGPCACPDDKDKAGDMCGKRSAFCQGGGIKIRYCYLKNVRKKKKEACG